MLSKTPQFNKALDEILEKLKPHQKKCLQCKNDFIGTKIFLPSIMGK